MLHNKLNYLTANLGSRGPSNSFDDSNQYLESSWTTRTKLFFVVYIFNLLSITQIKKLEHKFFPL